MIRYIRGNLLGIEAEALVNTVNEMGVMGKGIALMFSEAFPESAREYEAAARREEVRVGRMFVTESHMLLGPRWIIHFPTKKHWRNPSKLEWIREGLRDLSKVIEERGIRSVALPPLGCGNGGLDWYHVRREIEGVLSHLPDVEVIVFEPSSEYLNAPKRSGVEALTPARALMAEMVRRYSILGLECTNLEVQKMAWFLERVIQQMGCKDPLRLSFKANKFGPYADDLRHLLDAMDGSYLHCEKRLSDAGPMDLIWFDDSKREAVETYLKNPDAAAFVEAMEKTTALIDGFESPFGMELLSTVDWLLTRGQTEVSVEAIRAALATWPGGAAAGKRKLKLFDERMIEVALSRLEQSGLIAKQSVTS